MPKVDHEDVPDDCKSMLFRSSNFRDDCTDPGGFASGEDPYPNEVHHILCEHAILQIDPEGDSDGKKLAFIVASLCTTDWDINDSANLVGLPTNQAYRQLPRGNPPEFGPCHNVDHPMYTHECVQWLHTNVWNRLVDRRKSHETNGNNIVTGLGLCTKYFKLQLGIRRARGPGSTLRGWNNRFKEDFKDNWYHPLSMATDPSERSPGGRWNPPVLTIIG